VNRWKKENPKAKTARRDGLNEDQIAILELEENNARILDEMTRKLHAELFDEEYEYPYDNWYDKKLRDKGINPLTDEAVEAINRKRAKYGVSPITENGLPAADDSWQFCFGKAREEAFSDLKYRRPPADRCVICEKTIEETGGRRIIAQHSRGVKLGKRYEGGGNPERPHKSIKLYPESDTYVVVWGEKEFWTDARIKRAIQDYQDGRHPWFCQVCGLRTCSLCGSPINDPVGSATISAGGCVGQSPLLGVDPGCTNPECKKYTTVVPMGSELADL